MLNGVHDTSHEPLIDGSLTMGMHSAQAYRSLADLDEVLRAALHDGEPPHPDTAAAAADPATGRHVHRIAAQDIS